MAGDTVIRGAQPVEWVEESTFATDEADASWNWFGIVTGWSATQGVESESISYLPAEGSSDKLEKNVNVKHSEMWEGEVTYHPQNFDLLEYFAGGSGSTSDSLSSVQIGEIDEDNSEYRRLLGGVGEELTFSVGEDESAEVSASFVFADGNDWAGSDYVGTGSHATEDSSEPFKYGDLGSVQLGGSSIGDAVESIEFSISNDIAVVKDPDASRDSLISALVPVNREITVDLTLTYSDFSMATDVRNYTSQDLTFDVDTTSFTISDVAFSEFPYEFSAEDLVSDSLSSDPAGTITWS